MRCAPKPMIPAGAGSFLKPLVFFIANEVSPRFDHLTKEDTGFIGFKNMEQIAEHPLEENLAAIRRLKQDYPDKVLIASIMGENEQQWQELARLVEEAGADMIECNFSCPQMTSHAMGSDVGQSPELVEKYCRAVKRGSSLPMLAKMTPNIGDMCEVALAAKRGGADGIATINTVKSITNIDLNRKIGMPVVNGKSSISGYSGKAVKPIALRFIQQLRMHPELRDFPISGIGGIETWEDAAEFLLLGAATLQVTTGIMQYGYRIVEDMASGLSHYLADQGFASLQEMIGLANGNIIPAEDWIAAISSIRGLIRRNASAADVAISPAMTAVIRRWSGMNTAARRIAIRKNASVVCCAVMSARSPVLI